MASVTSLVYTVLSGFAGIQALVANGTSPETYRVFQLISPEQVDKPYVVFEKISLNRVNTMSNAGGAGVANSRIRVNNYAKTIAEAEALAEQVRLAMEAASSLEALPVFEQDFFELETRLYRVMTDYSVWVKH